ARSSRRERPGRSPCPATCPGHAASRSPASLRPARWPPSSPSPAPSVLGVIDSTGVGQDRRSEAAPHVHPRRLDEHPRAMGHLSRSCLVQKFLTTPLAILFNIRPSGVLELHEIGYHFAGIVLYFPEESRLQARIGHDFLQESAMMNHERPV